MPAHISGSPKTQHPIDLVSFRWQMVSLILFSINQLFVTRPSDLVILKILGSPIILILLGLLVSLESEFLTPGAILTPMPAIRVLRGRQSKVRAIPDSLVSTRRLDVPIPAVQLAFAVRPRTLEG